MYRVLWGELRLYIGMFFGARHSCRGLVIWLGFGMRTPRGFCPVAFFCRGSGVFRSFSLSLFFSSSFVLAAGLGVFLPLLCVLLQDTGPTSGTCTGRAAHMLPCLSFFLSLPGSVASLLFSLRLPSLSLSLFLSLSLSFASMHSVNLVLPPAVIRLSHRPSHAYLRARVSQQGGRWLITTAIFFCSA